MARERIDKLLVARGLFESRARAQAAIRAGLVRVADAVVPRPSDEVDVDAPIDAQAEHPYVSRGALKLKAALDRFGIDPAGCVAMDVGASTGGFTEVLLERGARRVFAVDVGRDQFHARLRARPEVRLLEGCDARALTAREIDLPVDVVVCDVSFISLALVLPPALSFAAPGARLAALVKPQFEAGPTHVKKGIVRDPAVHDAVCARVEGLIRDLGWTVDGLMPSPVLGGDGNREFLIGARRP